MRLRDHRKFQRGNLMELRIRRHRGMLNPVARPHPSFPQRREGEN